MLASDINNDGKLDVVIMHGIDCFSAPCRPSRIVTVMLGSGDGTFQPARDIDVNTFPHAIALGDFNGDGIKDLAVGGENTELSILLGAGNGTFALKPVLLLVPGGDLSPPATTSISQTSTATGSRTSSRRSGMARA